MTLIAYKRIAIIFFLTLIAAGCTGKDDRKIKLAKNGISNSGSNTKPTILQLSADRQHAIAITYFNNQTSDINLDWLSRGLADMLQTEFMQSPYLTVFPLNTQTGENLPKESASANYSSHLQAAREAQAEILLTGHYYKEGAFLLIDAEMIDVITGKIIRRESIRGEGLSQIFSMITRLSNQVRSNISGDLRDLKEAHNQLEAMTKSIEAYRCYSKALANMDKMLLSETERCLREAITYDSTFASAYLRMSRLKLSLHSTDEAQLYLRKVHRYAAKLSDVERVQLQLTEFQIRGEYREYLAKLAEAVKRYPGNIDLRLEYAWFHAEQGNSDLAITEFKSILAQDPQQANVYNLMGYLFARRGDFTSALHYIDKYKDIRPDEPNPYDSKGEILMLAGRLADAKAEFQTVIERWPQFFATPMRLAEIAVEEGDMETALKLSDQAIQNAPSDNVRIYYSVSRASLLWRFGLLKKAEALLGNIIAENPTHTYPLLLSVALFHEMGDSSKAKALQLTALNHYTREMANGRIDPEFTRELLRFALNASLPPQHFLQPISVLRRRIADTELNSLATFTEGLLQLRTGKQDKGRELLDELDNEFVELITQKQSYGWGSTWKYIMETMDYPLTDSPENHPLLQNIQEFAAETNRSSLKVMAGLLRSRLDDTYGLWHPGSKYLIDLGIPMESRWYLAGSFFPDGVSPFNNSFPPELRQDQLDQFQQRDRILKWQPADDGANDGYIDLKAQLKPSAWAVGYAWTTVYTPANRKAQIRLGTDESCKLWLNGELIWQHYIKSDAALDRDIVTVMLRPGHNKVLLKITNTNQDWGFFFRITDEQGKGFPDLEFYAPGELESQHAHR